MKNRDLYLSQLMQYKDKPLIKVVTGIRRCGKSTLLSLFSDHLIHTGILEKNIIRMNFESFEFDYISNYREMHDYINNRILDDKQKHYLLLDEVQMIPSWEKAVNSFLVDANVDIYITGSNAYLLSSELSTLLSGRYVEIKMLPLSFKEYLDFTDSSNQENLQLQFNQYLKFGGLPTVVDLLDNTNNIGPFLEGIYNTVLMKDVIERNSVRDSALLESVLKFIAANVGNIVSTKKVSDYLTSSGRKTTSDTIDNYLRMLENAFIIYKANRYDLKGKMFLKTLEKYYVVDIGFDYNYNIESLIKSVNNGDNVSVGLTIDGHGYVTEIWEAYEENEGTISCIKEEKGVIELTDGKHFNINYDDTTIILDGEGVYFENLLDAVNNNATLYAEIISDSKNEIEKMYVTTRH